MIIQFIKPYAPYNLGERANFAEGTALSLIARGAAVDATPKPESVPEQPRAKK